MTKRRGSSGRRTKDGKDTLHGNLVSHVDDLLFGGDQVAEESLRSVGEELGFRELERDSFTWCGKKFQREEDGTISLSMRAYHENLKEIYLPRHRKVTQRLL